MKKMLFLSAIIIAVLTVTSCQKDKPLSGSYSAFFNLENTPGIIKFATVEISEATANSVMINGSVLQKDGKRIYGRIELIDNMAFGIHIDGKWSHSPFSENYKIEGTFVEDYYQGGNAYQNTGTFQIKN